MNIKTGNSIEKRINKKGITVIILIVLLLGVLTIAAVWINQNDKSNEKTNELSGEKISQTVPASEPAIQQVAEEDFKVISTDYFTIKVPAGWSATTEKDEYSLLLNLNDEAGAPAGSVQMLAQGAKLYPSVDSDMYKQVIHRDEKSDQKTIITVLYTNQVDEHNATIIADIMKDSLKNTAVFETGMTTVDNETAGVSTEKVLTKLSVKEIKSFPLLRADWTAKKMQDAGLKKIVDPSGQINYFDGNVAYSFLDMAETPICTEIFGECNVETPRGVYIGESFDDVLASFPQDKDWKTEPNGVFYGNYYETDEHEPTGSVSANEGCQKMITLTTENVFPFLQIYFDNNDKVEKFRIYFISD